MQPSLNVDGLRSEDVGEQSRTVIPERAIAAIDMRLVKNITPKMQFDRLVAHIRAQGYFVTENEPTMEERRMHEKVAQSNDVERRLSSGNDVDGFARFR